MPKFHLKWGQPRRKNFYIFELPKLLWLSGKQSCRQFYIWVLMTLTFRCHLGHFGCAPILFFWPIDLYFKKIKIQHTYFILTSVIFYNIFWKVIKVKYSKQHMAKLVLLFKMLNYENVQDRRNHKRISRESLKNFPRIWCESNENLLI